MPIVDDDFIAKWVDRLRREFPDAVAILLKGSYARGEAGSFSDLDFDVLTGGEPRHAYPVYLVEAPAGGLVHVSIALFDLARWLGFAEEPAPWSLGLPAAEAMRLVWAGEDAPLDLLSRPAITHPAGDPELEDAVEALTKVKSAQRCGDAIAVRYVAQDLARRIPSMLRLINPPVVAGTAREALRLALSFPIAPAGYQEDMLVCLGLADRAATSSAVVAASVRLLTGVLALVSPIAGQLAQPDVPDLAPALADGSLTRYLAQDA
jgi:hypothetical protein